jgi:hypothetical protein
MRACAPRRPRRSPRSTAGCAEPGLDPAARRARARDHLRLDGRHQHGARRDDHDRRLRDLRRRRACSAQYARTAFDWYLLAALPVAFAVTAVVGMALERTVIRWLYGRPLETLLATWGISLMLIQTVRTCSARRTSRSRTRRGCPAACSSLAVGAAVQPHRHHRLRARGAGRRGWCSTARARAVRARRHAEPRDGRLHRRADRPRRHDGPSGWARASPGSPALRCRRSATSAPTSARPTSSTRSWSSCWAASASSPAP